MQQDHLRHPPNSRTGQVPASVHPSAPRRPGRNRPVSPSGHNAPRPQGPRGGRNRSVAGSGAGVSGCCGGGGSSLGETTVYSPSSKSPLRPNARCPMQRAIFLAFVARGLVNPTIDVARGWPWRAFSGGEWIRVPMAPANARCGRPPPPDGGIETAGRPPKIAIPSAVLSCDCCPPAAWRCPSRCGRFLGGVDRRRGLLIGVAG